jgi:predicted DsbA family dithiol-disulfide isomerase
MPLHHPLHCHRQPVALLIPLWGPVQMGYNVLTGIVGTGGRDGVDAALTGRGKEDTMNSRPVVEVFFDYICPWCYLGTVRTDRLQQEYGVQLRWSVFPLHPETPPEGRELSDLFAGREAMIRDMQARLLQIAAAEGLPLMVRSRTYNSRLAQELGKWAEEQGRGDQFRHAVYRAYFVEGVNISQGEELVRIAAAAGLPADVARTVLMERSRAAAVDADWQRAMDLRITAVPTHICGGERLAGFAEYEDFVRLIGESR